MTESQRKTALEWIERRLTSMNRTRDKNTLSKPHYEQISKSIEEHETILSALQAPQVECVTVEELMADDTMTRFNTDKLLLELLREKYPHGIRIIREKSDG